MRFVLRTQAWQCINDKILEGTKHVEHWRYLLRETRTRIAPFSFYECSMYTCVHSTEFLLSFSFSSFFLLFRSLCFDMATTKKIEEGDEEDEEGKGRRRTICCLLFGWLIFRVNVLSTLHLSLTFFFRLSLSLYVSFSPFSRRFVDKRPREEKNQPIERKEASNFLLRLWECFFCSLHQNSIQYPLSRLLSL